MDLWYLPKDISEVTNYKFVIIFMDQFSKLVWSYPVYEKNAITALQCFKKFVFSLGKPNRLYTDNDTEFKNHLNFCNKNNIIHVFS